MGEAAIVAAGLIVYAAGGLRHGELVNTDMTLTDQSAYMMYAQEVRKAPLEYVGGRNRMPLYPYLLALVDDDSLSDQAFFERGKHLNIVLGGVLLIGIYCMFRTSLSALSSLVLWAVTAFTVFMFRAAYVQVELLFYTLFFLSFVLMVRSLRRPTWRLSVATGFTVGLTHLAKASVLPGLFVFIGVATIAALADAWLRLVRDEPFVPRLLRRLAHPFVAAAVFLCVIGPYVVTSKEVFGHYFYNVNSTFYLWYDSWDEVVVGTRAHGDRVGWPDMPAEEIPGPTKYLREHSAWEVLRRPWRGAFKLYDVASRGYGYLRYVGLYLAFAAVVVVVRFRAVAKFIHRNPSIPWFIVLFLTAYLLLYAWYTPIASGSRLFLSLFLPIMWSLFTLLENRSFSLPIFKVRGLALRWPATAHVTVGLLILIDLGLVLWPKLLRVYAGT